MVELNFDSTEVEVQDFDAIPEGQYLAIIADSEMKPTKAGTGHYLQFSIQIIEGDQKGRYLWARLNLGNSNDLAVKIAQSELATICKAVGILKPKDSIELHDIPMYINVKTTKRKDTGDMVNEIKGYKSVSVNNESPVMQNKDAGNKAPWKKK